MLSPANIMAGFPFFCAWMYSMGFLGSNSILGGSAPSPPARPVHATGVSMHAHHSGHGSRHECHGQSARRACNVGMLHELEEKGQATREARSSNATPQEPAKGKVLPPTSQCRKPGHVLLRAHTAAPRQRAQRRWRDVKGGMGRTGRLPRFPWALRFLLQSIPVRLSRVSATPSSLTTCTLSPKRLAFHPAAQWHACTVKKLHHPRV